MGLTSRVFQFVAGASDSGRRLDLFLTSLLPDCSRSRAAELIRDGCFRVSGLVKKPGYRLQPGDQVEGTLPDMLAVGYAPEPLPLAVLYEDSHLLVIDKAPGMVVHPAPGHASGTLVNVLLYHCKDLAGIGGEIRPGIVHRLDKDTSGLMVVAKTEPVLNHLAAQFKERVVQKTYLALVHGAVKAESGEITLPIGRHQVLRKQMSVQSRHSRTAHTQWKVRERFEGSALLEVLLKTGRTHQIRVHLTAIGHPLLGDTVYGGRRDRKNREAVSRQMLHSWRLRFIHPVTGETMAFESPVPEDMRRVIEALRGDGAENQMPNTEHRTSNIQVQR